MATGASDVLLAEISALRLALAKTESKLEQAHLRLTTLERRLNEVDERRIATLIRESSKSVH